MESITACRSHISDRFPIASFAVQVPQERAFEIACATDPRLFHRAERRSRTTRNFYSTRVGGPLRAPRGETTWILPPDQLRRFAGAPRVYYALASYGRGGPQDIELSLPSAERPPSITLATDFTGRTLDRSRLSSGERANEVYGSPRGVELEWGGDAVFGAGDVTENPTEESGSYDDGYGPMAADEGQPENESVDPNDDPDAHSGAMALAEESETECHDDEVESGASYRGDDEGSAETSEEGTQPDSAGVSETAESLGDRGDEDCSDADQTDGSPYGSGAGTTAEKQAPSGRDSDYAEDESSAIESVAASALAVVVLDIPEKVRLLRIIQRYESAGAGYSGISRDAEFNDPKSGFYQKTHIGLSWGFIQFTQRSGGIGAVLSKAREREQRLRAQNALKPELFLDAIFGGNFDELLRVTSAATEEARLAPVAGALLWNEPWVARFRTAGAVDYIQASQNEVAIQNYLEPITPFARCLDLVTPRSLTMLLDRCINMGVFGGLRFVSNAIGPIGDVQRAEALRALGDADLGAFQQRFAPPLYVDGQWGPKTHIALVGALRTLGAASPVRVPTRDETLAAMVRAAGGKRYERRVRELSENRTDFDDTTTYAFA